MCAKCEWKLKCCIYISVQCRWSQYTSITFKCSLCRRTHAHTHNMHSVLSACLFIISHWFFMKIRCSVVTVGGRKNQTAFAFLCATSIFANFFSYFINLFPLLHINQVVSRLSGATRCHGASSRMLPRAWRLPWCSGTTPLRWWCCTTPTAQPQWCGWPSRNAWPHCSCSLKPSCSPWRTASLTAAWAFGSATWSRGRCRAQIVEHERGANHVKPPSHSQTSVSNSCKGWVNKKWFHFTVPVWVASSY